MVHNYIRIEAVYIYDVISSITLIPLRFTNFTFKKRMHCEFFISRCLKRLYKVDSGTKPILHNYIYIILIA